MGFTRRRSYDASLRPEGIKWPVDKEGRPTNRLELLTAQNGLDHAHAHDALNDVLATISLAQLIRGKQPKLFDYLLKVRDKQSVRALVKEGKPFVYSSGKYPSEYEKTAVVKMLSENSRGDGALVYDLRHDPTRFANMTADELAKAWRWQKPEDRSPDQARLPIKTVKYNRCPAVAPLAVLDEDSQTRLKIDLKSVQINQQKLSAILDWPERVLQALNILDGEQQQRFEGMDQHVDGQIYDGFVGEGDSQVMERIRKAEPQDLNGFADQFKDKRLKEILPLYKARNFPRKLTDEERASWEAYRTKQLTGGGPNSKLAKYFARLQQVSERPGLTETQKFLLEDLNLYGQSIAPVDVD